MENNNLSQENIASRISQLKNKQNNNLINRSSNGFPNALPQNNTSSFDTEEDSGETISEEELIEETPVQQNSFFESSALSNLKKTDDKEEINIADFAKKATKAKKTLSIIATVMPFVFPFVIVVIVVAVVMGQIMTVRDNITKLVENFTTGIEKFVNFAQGEGWMTDEDAFFTYLDEQYNDFEKFKSEGESLDIPLIAATIHYSKQVDFDKYEELEDDSKHDEDKGAYEEDKNVFEQIGGGITKEKTSSFYNIAKEKLGSVSTIYPGQKRLLGHLSNVKLEPGFYNYEAYKEYWSDFFKYALSVAKSTGMDIGEEILDTSVPVISFIRFYDKLQAYVEQYGSYTYGMEYDIANNVYELDEFLNTLSDVYATAKTVSGDGSSDSGLWFSIKVTTSMNTGYEEYQDLKQTTLEIKSALSKNNIEYTSDEDALEIAKNSSNSQIKSLHDKYEEIKSKYEYSYTHYLQTLYIPYTYFYKQDYTATQVDAIIEEIYDQRDFYNYLILKEEEVNTTIQCGEGTQSDELEELTEKEFIRTLGPLASMDYSKTNVLASVTVSLAILETDWGNDIVPNTNNIFNTKCDSSSTQGCILANTTNAAGTESQEYFRTYKNIEKSIDANSDLLITYDGLTDTADYKEQIRILKENNHITAKEEDKLLNLIKRYKLTKYDTIVDTTDWTCVVGDYANWKQYDEQWGSIPLSYTYGCNGKQCTIKDIGCLVTSYAILIERSGVPVQNIEGPFNPGSFVLALKKAGKIGGNGSFGGVVTDVAPTFQMVNSMTLTGRSKERMAEIIGGLRDEGYEMVMEVKKGCNGGQHWVAIDRVEGTDIYMFDPNATNTIVWELYPLHCISTVIWYSTK